MSPTLGVSESQPVTVVVFSVTYVETEGTGDYDAWLPWMLHMFCVRYAPRLLSCLRLLDPEDRGSVVR